MSNGWMLLWRRRAAFWRRRAEFCRDTLLETEAELDRRRGRDLLLLVLWRQVVELRAENVKMRRLLRWDNAEAS